MDAVVATILLVHQGGTSMSRKLRFGCLVFALVFLCGPWPFALLIGLVLLWMFCEEISSWYPGPGHPLANPYARAMIVFPGPVTGN